MINNFSKICIQLSVISSTKEKFILVFGWNAGTLKWKIKCFNQFFSLKISRHCDHYLPHFCVLSVAKF